MRGNLAVQLLVLLVVELFSRVQRDVVLSLRLLVLLLILHLNTHTHTHTHINPTDRTQYLCTRVSVWMSYVTLQLAGVQNVFQLQEVRQVRRTFWFLVLVGFILHLRDRRSVSND